MSRILVTNPNSNEAVTEGLRQALAVFARTGGPEIVCETLAEGPFGVETAGACRGRAPAPAPGQVRSDFRIRSECRLRTGGWSVRLNFSHQGLRDAR